MFVLYSSVFVSSDGFWGSVVLSSGVTDGVLGSGLLGSGVVVGSGVTVGSVGVAGVGVTGCSGVVGSGVAGAGLVGSVLAGSTPVGSGVACFLYVSKAAAACGLSERSISRTLFLIGGKIVECAM